ncbi:MAG: hypothetical protein QOK05_2024 [Chloroflexota bacterium]|jgi:hypothetical protein|nr:hypothetical protein [Chloroflexota bacterium]
MKPPETIRVLSYVCDGRVGARPELAEAIRAGIADGADVVSAQGNGMDAGPYYLGAGETGAPPTPANFEAAVWGAKTAGIPFVMSLGGRGGSDKQLEAYLKVFDEMARDKGRPIRAAVISGEVGKEFLRGKLDSGVAMPRLSPTPRLSEWLTRAEVDEAEVIQAQMGPEPIMAALKAYDEGEIDGVLTGRALDSGIHMAYPLHRGFPVATAGHMAKIIECGSMCCDPPNPFSAVMAEISRSGDISVWPALTKYRCTVKSVASHAVYERENPHEERNPGGVLDVSEAEYAQVDDRSVRVSGAAWLPTPYAVKLEGVRSLGHETAVLAVTNDPTLVAGVDAYVAHIVSEATDYVVTSGIAAAGTFKIVVHVIGAGVLPTGPADARRPSEVGLLVRVVAPTPEASLYIASTVRVRLQMSDYPGRTTTAGNLAFPLQKVFMEQGETHVFNIWHLLPLVDPTEPFPFNVIEFPRPTR